MTRLEAPRGRFGAREAFSLAALLLIVVLLALAAQALSRSSATTAPYSVDSPNPDGLLGLRLWLEAMGYRVEQPAFNSANVFDQADLILIYPPATPLAAELVERLSRWVESGRSLALVDVDDLQLQFAFGVSTGRRADRREGSVQPDQPLLPNAGSPMAWNRAGAPLHPSTVQGQAAVPVLVTANGEPTLLAQAHGEGMVWHLSSHHTLVNEDLRDGPGRQIVPALLRDVPAGGTVFILNGEPARGQQVGAGGGRGPVPIDGLGQWLWRRPGGWAALLCAVTALVYLLSQGRRLGPALQPAELRQRREAADYVRAMGRLMRRNGRRGAVALHHKARLKRGIGLAWQISPELADDVFLAQLGEHSALPPERLVSLRRLLADLRADISESTLVQRVAEVEAYLEARQ